jgi:hypothetical protein
MLRKIGSGAGQTRTSYLRATGQRDGDAGLGELPNPQRTRDAGDALTILLCSPLTTSVARMTAEQTSHENIDVMSCLLLPSALPPSARLIVGSQTLFQHASPSLRLRGLLQQSRSRGLRVFQEPARPYALQPWRLLKGRRASVN